MSTINESPSFNKVLSTTAKVIVAVVLISVVIGAVVAFIGGGVGIIASNHSSVPVSDNMEGFYTKEALARPTSMPASQWRKVVKAAIKERCVLGGMTKDDVSKAWGDPPRHTENEDASTDWWFEVSKTVCDKYNGEKCAQSHVNITETQDFHFAPTGVFVWITTEGPNSFDALKRGYTTNCFSADQPIVYNVVSAH